MNARLLSIVLMLSAGSAFTQGSILSMNVDPMNPAVNDTITISADLQFAYSDCVLESKNIALSGNTFYANAHHCTGMLTALCNITDTFIVLPPHIPGIYILDFTLTSGSGPVPCTPGIVSDDNQVTTFKIEDDAGTDNLNQEGVVLYPNPVGNELTVTGNYETIEIIDLYGNVLLTHDTSGESVNISNLSAGFYLCRIRVENKELLRRFRKM